MVQWFCLISWRLFDAWTLLFGIMSQYDPKFYLKINIGHCDYILLPSDFVLYLEDYLMYEHHTLGIKGQYDLTFDLKINVGLCDLYFMVQWLCLISPRLFDAWVTYLQITRQCDPNFDLKVNISQRDLYLQHHSWSNGSVWHIHWPYQVYVGQWPIFYGPAILLHILKTIWWRNIALGIMDHCDSDRPCKMYVGQWPIFHVPFILPCIIVRLKLFLYIKKWHRPGVFVSLRALTLVSSPVRSTRRAFVVTRLSASVFPSHYDKVLYANFSNIHTSTATHQKAFIFGP